MRNKRGQFYLVAAIIIVVILASFVVVSNYVRNTQVVKLTELKEELDIEIEKFLDYVIINNLAEQDAFDKFNNLSSIYLDKIGSQKNILFLFGDSTNININGKNPLTSENLSINYGIGYIELGESFKKNYAPNQSTILVKEGEEVYSFEMLEGKNFYYLVSRLDEGEKQVITG